MPFNGNNAILRKVIIVSLAVNYAYHLTLIIMSNQETVSPKSLAVPFALAKNELQWSLFSSNNSYISLLS